VTTVIFALMTTTPGQSPRHKPSDEIDEPVPIDIAHAFTSFMMLGDQHAALIGVV